MTATIIDSLFSLGEGLPFLTFLLLFVIVIFWSHAFVVVYHLIRFGIGTRPKIVAFLFFIGSAFLFSLTVFLYSQVELPSTEELFNGEQGNMIKLNIPFKINQ